LEPDADEPLIFQDEAEIHLHPALARQWAPVGQQPQVPAPGKNEKKVVYGGVDYRSGVLTYTVAASKCGAEFLAFLTLLVQASAGRKTRLVWGLNLIEQLWGHLNRTVLANVLYANLGDLVAAFRKGVKRMTGDRESMSFMFGHDDLTCEIQTQTHKRAA
jgi:hypothetical protein